MALTTTTEAESAARKKRKGKNFCAEEERQLCRSFLAVSQDPIPGNGRRTPAFWDRIHEHYTKNKPENAGERPARSLESKWGIIKHEVEKFDGCYGAVLALNEAGTSVEDVLRRALELYKLKHPKGLSFSFIHCWLLLKDIPKWAETSLTDEKKTTTTTTPVATTTTPTTMVKRKPTDMLLPRWADTSNEAKKTTPPVTTTTTKRKPTASSMVEGSEDCEVVESLSDSGESSPSGRKAVEWRRKNKKTQKLKESTMRAQAKATADMAAATLMKAEILQDQSALALFTMPDDQLTSAEAREYLQLRRQEELLKLRRRLAESNNNKSITTTITTTTTPAAAVVATSTPAATNTMTTTTNIDTTTTSITTTPQQPNSGMSTNPTAT